MQKREIEYEVSQQPLAKSHINTRTVQWTSRHKLILVIMQVFLASNSCISWPPLFYSISYKAREQRSLQDKLFTESDLIHMVKGNWSCPGFKQVLHHLL